MPLLSGAARAAAEGGAFSGRKRLEVQQMRQDAKIIIHEALTACLPDAAVRRALKELPMPRGRLLLLAVGKAAWQMAASAAEVLGERLDAGLVITKYGHCSGDIPRCEILEAGHPIPDENTFRATERAVSMVSGLRAEDKVLFLLSGGGSALFELPLIAPAELADITRQLLASGADITEMNTVRKHLSAVKGGRFAALCAPARVFSVVLSDIIGDPLDMIASGPAYPDSSTAAQAKAVAVKYDLLLSDEAWRAMERETPKALSNVTTTVTGSVRELCKAAANACERLGYRTIVLTDALCCQAREAGSFLASIARTHNGTKEALAFIAGGETVVRLTGKGLGGRNQELALSAAAGIAGLADALVFSVGSDGTDGPTDAAGGIVDDRTAERLTAQGISIDQTLADNDAYHALQAVDGLIMTGPTGTNVNDVAVLLLKR